ncbi:MAG: Gfo/Idh/MocA family oxidoreductase [Candidatus Nealsonbacteria bacterium]|nr:Gfo/Idh/MocA family oxidoreductase [Candidatus Nealsonbacteria bacterium]
MTRHTNRREFLKGTAAAGTGFWLAGRAGAQESNSPNEKLNVGIIGVNGRGRANMGGVSKENIVALCDIDENYLNKVKAAHPNAKTYVDWRKMLDQKDLDAVTVSTADQVHALASNWAMKRGLSVYCEKPLAHSVHEARTVRETYIANRDKLATQMGTQIHAGNNYRRVVELVQSKAIGEVREAHAWCGRQGPGGGLPEGEDPVPENLHWDLWLGPAPARPYNKGYLPGNLTWNRWWDFGNGTLGDMGSHVIDLAFWALKLRHPSSVEVVADPMPASPFTNAKWMEITWEHPAVDDRPALKLTWHDGIKRPESPPGHDLTKWGLGVMFIGDKGTLLADYGKHVLLPADKFQDFQPPEPSIAPSLGHHQEWIHACKTGEPTTCNFDYSGLLIEHNLLGNVAYRVGKKLQWDAANLKATNCPEADQFIRREYREGWTL